MFLLNFPDVVNLRLESIAFSNMPTLVEVICGFPRLQTLSIRKSGIIEFDLPPSTMFQPSAHLVALDLHMLGMDEVLEWFLALAVPPRWRSVCLYPRATIDEEHRFIAALDESLEHLSFAIYGADERSLLSIHHK
jgi:hypothetical protein